MVSDKVKWPFRSAVKLGGYAARFILVVPRFMKVHPSFVSASTIVTTVAAMVFHDNLQLFFALLVLTLVLVFADRFIVRKYYAYDASSRMSALVSDRISEGLLFTLFFSPWFFLFTFNCVLMVYSYVRKRSIVLPLKEFFVLYYLFFVLL